MGVVVEDRPRLQHLVGREPEAGHEVAGTECRLLDLGEVVLRVAVEDHPADGMSG